MGEKKGRMWNEKQQRKRIDIAQHQSLHAEKRREEVDRIEEKLREQKEQNRRGSLVEKRAYIDYSRSYTDIVIIWTSINFLEGITK